MIARSMIAGAVLLTLSACCAHRAAPGASGATAVAGFEAASGPVKATSSTFIDEDGNTVLVRLDRSELARKEPLVVTDKGGSKLPVYRYALRDVAVCLPSGAGAAATAGTGQPACQPATSMTEGTFFKLGMASCTCRTIMEGITCYGSTCPKK